MTHAARSTGLFRHRFPMAFALVPLLPLYWIHDPCQVKLAVILALLWGYLGILAQILRGEAYDRFGWSVLYVRAEQPDSYHRSILSDFSLWAAMHWFALQPFVLSRFTS